MKKLLRLHAFSCLAISSLYSQGQCGAGYTTAQLNWDKLDYYYNSGGGAPYGSYVTNAMEQTQKFAIGPNYLTFTTSTAGIIKGKNATHTGNITGYAGDDAQFTPSADGQTITLTFNTPVQNLKFALYDIDGSAKFDFAAYDASNVLQSVSLSVQATTILTPTSGTAASVSATSSTLSNSSSQGSVEVSVSSSVKKMVIIITSKGSDAAFWLTDINACVSGSFPTNYQQTGNNRPLQGPAGNQPDYFLITPDNDSVYMVDPATGVATALFGDPANTYTNSLAYDPYNHILYYVSENYPAGATNKTLKKYDFNTGTITTIFSDITAALNIPTFDQSLEGAGACFYNGQLYLGIEGGRYNSSNTRESMVFRIDFDASLNPTNVCQVFSIPCYKNGTSTMLHDWADFVIKDGILYNFNSRPGTTMVSFEHFDMMTGTSTPYNNPGNTNYAGQSGLDWAGNIYNYLSTGIAKYNGNGTYGSVVTITNSTWIAWVGGNGDASENFRPQVDFGDAPASYDPNALSPASHSQDPNLRLGTNQDKEWITNGQTALANSDNYDDGLAYVTNLVPSSGSYLTTVSVYNNTGNPATVCAWLDYNGNGVFDPSEGISASVPLSSASAQSVNLFWPSLTSSLAIGTFTYLRIRVTYASNNMTTANPTGYFNGGEVEDYRVYVNTTPLEVQYSDFNVQLTKNKTAKLTWSSQEEADIAYYVIEKSADNTNWTTVDFANSKMQAGLVKHEATDMNVAEGITYYRLKTIQKTGKPSLSTIRQIENKTGRFSLLISPNPVTSKAFATISSASAEEAVLQVVNDQGMILYQNKVHLNAGTNSIELPLAGFANGRYIVNITTGSKFLRQSLTVNK